MRVSRAQAEENRRTVIDVASRLFRERGFDGIGLSDLMKGAGLTQGGFYKQFQSKEDLIVQATAQALEHSRGKWAEALDKARNPLRALVRFYLSEPHREELAGGCALAALGAEAARRSPELRQAFEDGIKTQLDTLDELVTPGPGESTRDKSIVTLATMVGALVLSRAVEDERLSKRFLRAVTDALLRDAPEGDAGQGREQERRR